MTLAEALDEATVKPIDWIATKRKLDEYTKAAERDGRTEEDIVLRQVYRSLERGEHVINLARALASSPWDDDGRPVVVAAPSDATRVWFGRLHSRAKRDARSYACQPHWDFWRKRCAGRMFFDVPPFDGARKWYERGGKVTALVPPVPPRLRPRAPQHYVTLFEADWEGPPVDPALLKRVAGPFYRVLGVWDLTDAERSLLGWPE